MNTEIIDYTKLAKIFVEKRSTMPILCYVAVVHDKMFTSNLEYSLICPANGLDTGMYHVDPFLKSEISVEDYPTVEPKEFKFVHSFTVELDKLDRSIAHASLDTGRFTLNSVCLSTRYGLLSTDGKRMFVERIDYKVVKDRTFLLPLIAAKKLSKVLKALKTSECKISVSLTHAKIVLKGDIQIYIRLIDGEYPEISAVLPDSTPKSSICFTPNKEHIKILSSWLKLQPTDKNHIDMYLGLKNNELTASWIPGEGALAKEMPVLLLASNCKLQPDFKIRLRVDQVIDALIPKESMTVNFYGSLRAIIFRSKDESFSLLMPCRDPRN